MKNIFNVFIILFLFAGCKKSPDITADYLGGGTILDSSIYNPRDFLVSASNPNSTPAEAQKPGIIACHGYSASTFEWNEFRTWSAARTDYYISQVLLAGHGTTHDDSKKINLARLADVY